MKTNRRSFLALLGLAPIVAKSAVLDPVEKSPPTPLDLNKFANIVAVPRLDAPEWRIERDCRGVSNEFGETVGMIVFDCFILTRRLPYGVRPVYCADFPIGLTIAELAKFEGIPDEVVRMVPANLICMRRDINFTAYVTIWKLDSFQKKTC